MRVFFQTLIKDSEELGLFIEWNTGSFSSKLPDPKGSGIKIGIATFDKAGLFYLGYSRAQFEKLEMTLELSYQFCADTAAMLPGIKQNPDKKHIWNKYSTLADLKPVYPKFLERVKQYINDISSWEKQSSNANL